MKWLAVIVLLVGIALFWFSGEIERPDASEVAKSSRRVLDKRWRALPEKEMTIAEMERYAAGLSDEELWEEFVALSRRWLEVNAKLIRPFPPRLVIMVGREIGKRHGLAGFDLVLDHLYDLEEHLGNHAAGSDEVLLIAYLDDLVDQMEAAVFGGWIKKAPEDAIEAMISWWDGYENNSVGGYYESLEDVLRGNMVGEVLREMAEGNPQKAFELLEKVQDTLPWFCEEMIGDFILGVSSGDRAQWRERVQNRWPKSDFLHIPPHGSFLEVKRVIIEHPELRGWQIVNFVKRFDPRMIHRLALDEELALSRREDFAIHLFYNGELRVGELNSFPLEIQERVFTKLVYGIRNWDSRDFSGPIDGTESTRVQDRTERIGPLEEALRNSELNEGRKNELRGVLNEVRPEMDKDLLIRQE